MLGKLTVGTVKIRIIYVINIKLVTSFIVNGVSSMKTKAFDCSFKACMFRIILKIIFDIHLIQRLTIHLSISSNYHPLSFYFIQHQAWLISNIMLFNMLLSHLGIVILLHLLIISRISFYWIFVNLFIHLKLYWMYFVIVTISFLLLIHTSLQMFVFWSYFSQGFFILSGWEIPLTLDF